MPIPLRITYEDSTVEDIMLPAELWSQNNPRVSKLLVTEQPIASVEVDPRRRIADADTSNNRYPQEVEDSRFRITKSTPGRNPMQRQLTEDARRESSGVAVTVARVLPGAWWMLTEERGDATPSEMSSELLAHERIADLRDPWDQPVTIELSGSASRDDDPEVTEFSRVRSIGPDGTPGTEDDLLWVIYLDGHIAEMETGKE